LKSLSLVRVAVIGLCLPLAAQAADVSELAKKVDEHYNHLRTLRCEFTETYSGAGMEREEAGTLWMKKPGKMRWDYRSPREKLFLSDGKYAWFYIPADRQVRKSEVKKLEDLRSPLAFLLGKTKLQKELDGLSLAPDAPASPGNAVLRGIPKAMADRVSEVELEVTPEGKIVRIRIEEIDGSITEFRLTKQQENVAVGDDLFRFSPPAGVEVVEGTFGQ
jgi:outer membrane lipoprotein carrier protein